MKPGDKVLVKSGPHKGRQGVLLSHGPKGWLMTLPRHSVTITVREWRLEVTRPFVIDFWLP